jgi:hypothetical protein
MTTTTDVALTGATTDIRVIRDRATGSVAIVLDATAADLLDSYLDGLGALHDLAGDDADPTTLAAADVVLTIRGLLRA